MLQSECFIVDASGSLWHKMELTSDSEPLTEDSSDISDLQTNEGQTWKLAWLGLRGGNRPRIPFWAWFCGDHRFASRGFVQHTRYQRKNILVFRGSTRYTFASRLLPMARMPASGFLMLLSSNIMTVVQVFECHFGNTFSDKLPTHCLGWSALTSHLFLAYFLPK